MNEFNYSGPAAPQAKSAHLAKPADPISELVGNSAAWFRRQVRISATKFGVDPDDLMQEVLIKTLRGIPIDPNSRGVRTYLGRLIDWTATDLMRQLRRAPVVHLGVDLSGIDELPGSAAENHATSTAGELDLGSLHKLGLSRDQATALAFRMSPAAAGMSWKDFAALTGRSYAAVRKDYQRGVRILEEQFNLTDTERKTYIAFRRCASTDAAAELLKISEQEVILRLNSAKRKIWAVVNDLRE